MLLANYHVHSDYCDGKNTLEEMVVAGIAAGFVSMGLSSHFPLPFLNDWTMEETKLDAYFNEVLSLKEKYASKIELYLGMEIDYFVDRQDVRELAKDVMPRLDYTIMSIHTLGVTYGDDVSYIDDSQEDFAIGLKKYYRNDVQAFVKDYYQGIAKMVSMYQPDIIGHIDLIKKYNQDNFFFNENETWYQEIVKQCLDSIGATRTRMEINTGANNRGLRVGRYPSDWMIPEMVKRNIPITIGGDSHSIEGIAYDYIETEKYLLDSGYKKYWILKKGRWETQPLGV